MLNLLTSCRGYALLLEYFPEGIREVGIDPADLRDFISDLDLDFAYGAPGADLALCRYSSVKELCSAMETDTAGQNIIIGRGVKHESLICKEPASVSGTAGIDSETMQKRSSLEMLEDSSAGSPGVTTAPY